MREPPYLRTQSRSLKRWRTSIYVSLWEVTVAMNQLGDDGASALADVIRDSRRLVCLKLGKELISLGFIKLH